MTQKAVVILIGSLVTDEALRREFTERPGEVLEALHRDGLELTRVEMEALESLDPDALARFARAIDARLQKAALGAAEADPR